MWSKFEVVGEMKFTDKMLTFINYFEVRHFVVLSNNYDVH